MQNTLHSSAIAPTAIRQYDTVADMLASVGVADGQLCVTSRYSALHVVGDGSGNVYMYSAGSASDIDGGFVLPGVGGSLAFSFPTGTAQSGTVNSIILSTEAPETDDIYNDCVIEITSGTGAGQYACISDYNGTTKVATLSVPFTDPPDNTSVYRVIAPTFSGTAGTGSFLAINQKDAIAEQFGSISDGVANPISGTDNLTSLTFWAKKKKRIISGGVHYTTLPIVMVGGETLGGSIASETTAIYYRGSMRFIGFEVNAKHHCLQTCGSVLNSLMRNLNMRTYSAGYSCLRWSHSNLRSEVSNVYLTASGAGHTVPVFVVDYKGQTNDIRIYGLGLRMWNSPHSIAMDVFRNDSVPNFNDHWTLDQIQLEQCDGGGIRFAGTRNVSVKNVLGYDNVNVTGTQLAFVDSGQPFFKRSEFCTVENYGRTKGTLSGGAVDIDFDSTGGRGNFTAINCQSREVAVMIDCGNDTGTRTNIINCDRATLTNTGVNTSVISCLDVSAGDWSLLGAVRKQRADSIAYAASISLDFDTGDGDNKHIASLTDAVTIAAMTATRVGDYTILARSQDGTPKLITWPPEINKAPPCCVSSSEYQVFRFYWDGVSWHYFG